MFISRQVPASILLPDGTVLFLSGENPQLDQITYESRDGSQDPRLPQIFDPELKTMSLELQEGNSRDVFRGYHNMAALLKDGSVLVGGGFNQYGDVGCENPNIRIFRPKLPVTGAAARHLCDSCQWRALNASRASGC